MKKIIVIGLIVTSIVSIVSITSRRPIVVLSPEYAILLLYTSGTTLILHRSFYLKTISKRFQYPSIKVPLRISVNYLTLTAALILFILILIPGNAITHQLTFSSIVLVALLESLFIIRANSKYSLLGTLLLAYFVSWYVWLHYPYYVGNDTNRDLCYTFNTFLKGHYEGRGSYPLNIVTYLYAVLSLILNSQIITLAIPIVEMMYISSLIIILMFLTKNKRGGGNSSILLLLSQPYFVLFLASWFINQTLALLFGAILLYLLLFKESRRSYSISDGVVLLLLGIILPLTHGFVALYVAGFLLLLVFYSWKNKLNNSNSMLFKRVAIVILITLTLYTTYTSLLEWIAGSQKTLTMFLENFVHIIIGKDDLTVKITPARVTGIGMLWLYMPFANLLVLALVEYLTKDKYNSYSSDVFDLLFIYPIIWIVIGIITSVDPALSMLRYFVVPAILFLSGYPRKIIVKSKVISKTIVYLLIGFSVGAVFTNGSIISTLDLAGSGHGYLVFPPETDETELVSKFFLETVDRSISIVVDINLGKGITMAAITRKNISQPIMGYLKGYYLPVDTVIIELKLLGSYDLVLNDEAFVEVKLKDQLLMLRPKALEYMHLYRLSTPYSEILKQSQAVILCSRDIYVGLFLKLR